MSEEKQFAVQVGDLFVESIETQETSGEDILASVVFTIHIKDADVRDAYELDVLREAMRVLRTHNMKPQLVEIKTVQVAMPVDGQDGSAV